MLRARCGGCRPKRGPIGDAVDRIPTMGQTICFRVVKEPYGWAVRMGEGMMTPFRSRILALQHARGVADALRRCGEPAEVVIEETYPPSGQGGSAASSPL